ncbi:MAG: CBS domain-containing protein [Candidatus Heimdallarchaeota archaeon]
MKVADVMTTEFKTVDKDQMMSNALNILGKKKQTTRLIVVDKDKPVGIISFRDVADRLGTHKTEGISPRSLRVSSAMSFPIVTISSDMDLIEAAQLMIENNISSLIVVDDDELKGLLTKHDLLALGLKCKKIKVKDMMTPEPMQVSSSERLISARNTMFEHNFSALPVVDDGQLVGLVDDEIIAEAFARLREKVPAKHQKRRLQEFYVGQVMKSEPPTMDGSAPLCDIVQKFIDTKSKAVFVLDEEKLVGILSVTDIAQAIAEERL